MMRDEPTRTPETDALDHALTTLYQQDANVPARFGAAWRDAIRREEQIQMKKQSFAKRFWKIALPTAAALVLVVGALCTDAALPAPGAEDGVVASRSAYGAKYAAANTAGESVQYAADADYGVSADMADGAALSAGAPTPSVSGSADVSAPLPAGSKLVRTVDLTLSTRQFDTAQQQLLAQVAAVGGYVESSSVYGDVSENQPRTGNYALRIPSARLDEFLAYAEGVARVTYRGESATDMSTQYSDSQTRLQTQQTKMERLQALLAQATQMSDIIELESAIADTQYTLDWYQTQLNQIDDRVNLSQVSVTLSEESVGAAAQSEEVSLGERIRSGFAASMKGLGRFFQNMLVFVVMASPVLAGLCVLGVVVWLVVRAKRRKHPAQEPDAEERADEN